MTDTHIIHQLAAALSKEGTTLSQFQTELFKIVRDHTLKDNDVLKSAAYRLLYAIQEYKRSNDTYKQEFAAGVLALEDI